MTVLLLAPLLGLLVGLVMGALGGGGAVVSVPVLVYLLHQPVREATTISLVVVLFGAVVGLLGLRGTGRVDWRTGLVFGGLGLGGSVLGSRASALVDPRVLLAGFSALLAVVGVLTWLHARRTEASAEEAREVSLTQLVPTAFGVGALTGFFGVGGGFVTVPALTVVMRLPAVVATSTSLV
ncbi:MAG: TSUP family transporter, partial [Terrabacter sp.]